MKKVFVFILLPIFIIVRIFSKCIVQDLIIGLFSSFLELVCFNVFSFVSRLLACPIQFLIDLVFSFPVCFEICNGFDDNVMTISQCFVLAATIG